ncbi:DUF6350 family protein [Streptomyces sp. NPDC056387]|uniref:cell division protein PerM n=1 Tax=Streptomyces sp. NPDC056387 TaxID=3345803 RepID=UPI0035DE3846
MTQVTERGTPLPTARRAAAGRRRSPAAAACVLGGAMAAGLGLGFLAVLVIVLWISSPYPDSGPGGALHLAAGLWLLAHGTELVRYDTLSGVPAPVGVTPLLLVGLPALLMRRAARLGSASGDGRDGGEEGDGDEILPAGAVFSAVTCGYLCVGSLVTVYAAGGPMPADPLSAAWHVPLVAVLAAAGGVWAAKGRPAGPLPHRVPEAVRRAVTRPRYAVALRAGAAGTLVLLGGGALLVGASLAWHAAEVQGSFLALTGVWSGRFAVLLLALALLPNAVVWGAAYALGPGFDLGAGATATPLGFAGSPALPRFPLLDALPPEGPGTLLTCAAAGVPLVAGLAVGWFAVRRAREVRYRETALTAALGALVCALLMAGLAAAASGPLGSRGLASFGPVWWATGAAAFVWTLVPAVPVAVAVHSWRTRPARQPDALAMEAEDDWHDSGGRELRWEALRRAAGSLIPDLAQDAPPPPPEPEHGHGPEPEPGHGLRLGHGPEHGHGPEREHGHGYGPEPEQGHGRESEPVPTAPETQAAATAPAKPPRRLTVVTGLHLVLTAVPAPAKPAAPPAEPPRPAVAPVAGARVLARRKPPA